MTITRIPYTADHFLKIRDFLVDTYQANSCHHNWHIDRWNFCRHVSQVIHETVETWPETVGIWVDGNDEIQAVVNSEGEEHGEAFFQLGYRTFSDQELEQFLDFAEDHLSMIGEDSRKRVLLHAGLAFDQLNRILVDRGYQLTGSEETGILDISGALEVTLPDGLRLVEGVGFSDQARGLAHSLAFGYAREGEGVLEKYHTVEAFANMRLAPDYRGGLDLAVLTPEGDVAGFANFWFDDANRIGILEPLGTVPAYQKKGVATALLSEGINRLRELGAVRLYGGAGQEFYTRFGFEIVDYREIWSKEW